MKQLILITTLTASSLTVFGQEIFAQDGFAIRGFDPVAFFTEQKAIEGKENFSFEWKGVIWKFASKENLQAFSKDPEKYAPQFGGFCAYGVSEDHKSPTSPEAFTIVDGKLYLNYNLRVRELWNKDQAERIKQGEKNWPQLKTSQKD